MNNKAVSFREMKYLDLIDVQQLNIRNLPENYGMQFYLYHLTRYPNVSFVAVNTTRDNQNEKQNEKENSMIVYDDKEIVGYIIGKLEYENDKNRVMGHVLSLSVDYHYRGKGIGESLLKLCLEALKKESFDFYQQSEDIQVSLKVRVGNTKAINFYTKNGFNEMEIVNNYYENGESAATMTIKL